MDKNLNFNEFLEKVSRHDVDGAVGKLREYCEVNLRIKANEVRDFLQNMLGILKDRLDERLEAWALLYLGWYYLDTACYEEAIKYHVRANKIFLEHDDKQGLVRSFNALHVDYIQMGIFDLAIEYGLEGVKYAEEIQDDEGLHVLLTNTAHAYFRSKHIEESQDILVRHMNSPFLQHPERYISFYSLLSEIKYVKNELEEALTMCENIIKKVEESNIKMALADTLHTRALIYFKMNCLEKMEVDLKAVLNLAEEYKNRDVLVRGLLSFAKLEIKRQNIEEAEKLFEQALNENHELKSNILYEMIYKELSLFYEESGQFEKAYFAAKKHSEYEKEIFNKNSSAWFARLNNEKIAQDAQVYKRLYHEIELISNIGKRITLNLSKHETLEATYQEMRNLVEADIFGLALYHEDKGYLDYELFVERGEKRSAGIIPIDADNSFGPYCVKNKTHLLINDLEHEASHYLKGDGAADLTKKSCVRSAIYCPLIIEEQVIGILSVQSFKKNTYSKQDVVKLDLLSSYIAIALENAKLYNQVEYLAKYDTLTQLLGRGEVLNQATKLLVDKEDKEYLGVIMLDIDRFKNINDTYGHNNGDIVLKRVSNLMKSVVDTNGVIGRIGGEEFLMVIKDTETQKILNLLTDLKNKIEAETFIEVHQELKVTVSMGVHFVHEQQLSLENAIKYADEALYEAKYSGRNKIVVA